MRGSHGSGGPTVRDPGRRANPDGAAIDRRRVIAGGSAAGLGVVASVLPAAAAATSTGGLLSPSGSLDSPTNFTAMAGDGRVMLSWDPVDGADRYQVQYRESASAAFDLFVDVTAGTSATILGLTNSTSYDFRVVAVQDATVSDPAGPLSATPALSAPGIPEGLSVAPGASLELVATWELPLDGGAATLYRVQYRVSPGGTYADAGTTTTLSFTITGLAADTAYDVQVRAENSAGESGYTAAVTGTALADAAIQAFAPQPPVVGVVTYVSGRRLLHYNSLRDTIQTQIDYSLVVATDRLLESGAGYNYSWKESSAPDSSYQAVTFANAGTSTFTISVAAGNNGWSSVGGYTVRKVNGGSTFLSSFTYSFRLRTYGMSTSEIVIDNAVTASGGNQSYVGSVSVDLYGGGGGAGGRDTFGLSVRNGGDPSAPGRVQAIVPFGPGEQLRLAVGGSGGQGADDVTSGGAGTAGTNTPLPAYDGGRGGNTGGSPNAGGGGGGGAATVLRRVDGGDGTTTVIAVAGGAGGGGGGNLDTGRRGADAGTTPGGRTGATTGQDGAEFTTNVDAPGGGGGGGGAVGGLGGLLEGPFFGVERRTKLDPDSARPGANLVGTGLVASVDGLAEPDTAPYWPSPTVTAPQVVVPSTAVVFFIEVTGLTSST